MTASAFASSLRSATLPTRLGATACRRLAAAAVVLASLAALAFLAIGGTQGAGAAVRKPALAHARTSYEKSVSTAVERLLNTERRAHNLPALRMNAKLMSSARTHDLAMAKADTLSHQLPHEAFFATRISRAGYKWSYAGENIAWNSRISTTAVLQLEQMMYNERPPFDEHRQNILSKHFHDVGIDVFVDQVHHKVWLTTDFGHH
jgi:uncharacterized protein YkwD